jgi:hypothetical protein
MEGDRVRVERFSSLEREGIEAVHEVLDQWLAWEI